MLHVWACAGDRSRAEGVRCRGSGLTFFGRPAECVEVAALAGCLLDFVFPVPLCKLGLMPSSSPAGELPALAGGGCLAQVCTQRGDTASSDRILDACLYHSLSFTSTLPLQTQAQLQEH